MLTQTADLVAPMATINIGPGGKTKDRTPTFYFSADEDNATFKCKIDSGGYRNCTSPETTAKLTYGRHTFSVKGKDAAGNTGAADSLSFKLVRP